MHALNLLLISDEKKLVLFLRRVMKKIHIGLEIAQDEDRAKRTVQDSRFDLILVIDKASELRWKKRVKDTENHAIPVMIIGEKILAEARGKRPEGSTEQDALTALDEFRDRLRMVAPVVMAGASQKLERVGISMNLTTREVRREGRIVSLTPREFALLEFLMMNPDRILSRGVISKKIWNYDFDTGTNVIDVYINHLRGKIENGFEKKVIHTIRGIGYYFGER